MTEDPIQQRHPAAPEQTDEGFAEGQEQLPDAPAGKQREPDFAGGMHRGPHDEETRGRFSRGQEQLRDTPDQTVERRFSEGQEASAIGE